MWVPSININFHLWNYYLSLYSYLALAPVALFPSEASVQFLSIWIKLAIVEHYMYSVP